MRVIRSRTAGRGRRDTKRNHHETSWTAANQENLRYLLILINLTESFNPVSPLQKDLLFLYAGAVP